MDGNQSSYFTVFDQKTRSKFICCTRRKAGNLSICLTDAADVWSIDYSEDRLSEFRQKFALNSTEDYILKIRSACGAENVSVVLQDTSAELCLGSPDQEMSVSLPRMDGQLAKQELRELLFSMADDLTQANRRSDLSSSSKYQHWPPEFELRQQQNSAPAAVVKKRPLGHSLINPGTKRKHHATGVAFDDTDDH